jgi:hemolysin III
MHDEVCPISGESRMEEVANSVTHGIGLAASVVGAFVLIGTSYVHGDAWHVGGCTIFALTCILLYLASTVYHSCRVPERKKIFRVLDHACIYLMIAASYTPFIFGPLRGSLGWTICIVVWSIAIMGVIIKVFFTGRFILLSTCSYLFMGWMCVLIAEPILEKIPWEGITWMMVGGAFYSAGVIFFLWESLPFSHAIWHVFTIGGSACHYYSILCYVIPYG